MLHFSPILAGAVLAAACVGTIGDGGAGSGDGANGNGTTSSAVCAAPSPASAPLRRLTQSEYNNTVRDLLGDGSRPADAFPPDQKVGDFSNTAVALTVPPLLAQAYESAAESLAAKAVTNLAALLPCDPSKDGEDACAKSFITSFGKRAFRRPLAQDEIDGLVALYTTNRSGADFKNGVTGVIEAVLQSAPFLYRPELGDASRARGSAVPLTSYEMASRLSYFLWGSMPDDALFAAAEQNQLTTPEQLTAQARRLLADPRSHVAVQQFYTEWLTLGIVSGIAKDPKTYPEFTPTLQAAMSAETRAFVDWVMWSSDAKLSTLLTAPVSFVNEELASLYGIQGVTGTALQKVDLDPSQRSGLLTQAALMTLLGKPDRSSPVLRGKFVRERLLCQTIQPPPANIVITPPPVMPGVTTRQMFSAHDKVEPCKSCHVLMDPIGFGFEHFDGVGKWRTQDQGQPVDATGALSASDVDGPYDGAIALTKKLAESQEVGDCVATEWFRYALGRGETQDDTCALGALKKSFASSGQDIRELLVAITVSDAFRYRPQAATEVMP